MMNFFFAVICVISTIWCSGCNHVYNGLQAYSVSNCYALPYSDQQQCLEQVQSTYDAYEQDRNKALPLAQTDQDENGGQPLKY